MAGKIVHFATLLLFVLLLATTKAGKSSSLAEYFGSSDFGAKACSAHGTICKLPPSGSTQNPCCSASDTCQTVNPVAGQTGTTGACGCCNDSPLTSVNPSTLPATAQTLASCIQNVQSGASNCV